MKRIFVVMMAAVVLLGMSAGDQRFVQRIYSEVLPVMKSEIARDVQNRAAKRQVLPLHSHLLTGEERFWTDGINLFGTYYHPKENYLAVSLVGNTDTKLFSEPIAKLTVRGGKVCRGDVRGTQVTVERLGSYVMLVERDDAGSPVTAYYALSREQHDSDTWTLMLQYLLAGNYATSTGEHAVFGPKLPFYDGKSYDVDPGGLSAFSVADDFSAIDILYGEGRVSRGDPSHPKYKAQMPGGGGAGALMPAMQWRVKPTVEGLHVEVVSDQKFVDHNPRVESNSVLTKVQSPYEGIPGKWAFASVMPLTHQLLKLFPKRVLTLMRGEIYARHGDTFKNADTQRYFDAQPWYHKSGGKVTLTDIERFNYALIKGVELSK